MMSRAHPIFCRQLELPARGLKRAGTAATAVLLALYMWVVAIHHAPVAAGADSGGYFNLAKLLTEGRLMTPARIVPEVPPDLALQTPLGFVADARRTAMLPSYPTGLPLHYALASSVLGWAAGPTLVAVLAALACVTGTYATLRVLGIRPLVAWVGAAAVAMSPMLLYMAFLPMSDNLAAAWWIWSVYSALRSATRPAWGIWAGLAFSVSVLVRPTQLLLAPALFLLLWHPRACLAACLGALPAAGWLLTYNVYVFGDPFTTGYGNLLVEFSRATLGRAR